MSDKEKLIDLLRESGVSFEYHSAEEIAEHLISNGVTVRNRGRWIIHPSGRSKGDYKYAECSVCHVTGSPHWKSCPVCDSLMEG